MTIVDAEELGGAMTEKLAELFSENGPAPQAAPSRQGAPLRGGTRVTRPVSVVG